MRKVQASALYFVLIISLIVLVLISTFISFLYFQKQYISSYEAEKRVNNNLRYAELLIANDDLFRNEIIDSTTIDLFGAGDDTVKIVRRKWGLFDFVKIRASYKRANKANVMFYANAMSDTDTLSATLYLRDKQNLLSLAGDTKIFGRCYLPKAGVKPAIVEGKPFEGKKLIEGIIKNSTNQFPLIDSAILKEVVLLYDSNYVKEKYSPNYRMYKIDNTIQQSFENYPIIYLDKNKIDIVNTSIAGHCILYSSKEINIYKEAQLMDVILIAPIVRLKKGFKGNVQIFAKDTLLIEDDVELTYPSVLFTYQTRENDSRISIGKNVKITGSILTVDESSEDKNGRMLVSKGTVLRGNIWCEGYLDFNGIMKGCIVTHKFIKSTTSTVYENHLLDVYINGNVLSNKYLFPTIFPSKRIALLKSLK